MIRAVILAAFFLTPCVAFGATNTYNGLQRIYYADPYCESGGNPHNTRNSTYRGKWQFDQTTWNAFAPRWLHWDGVNGHQNDPASVSEYWQDRVAVRVTYDAWPNC